MKRSLKFALEFANTGKRACWLRLLRSFHDPEIRKVGQKNAQFRNGPHCWKKHRRPTLIATKSVGSSKSYGDNRRGRKA